MASPSSVLKFPIILGKAGAKGVMGREERRTGKPAKSISCVEYLRNQSKM